MLSNELTALCKLSERALLDQRYKNSAVLVIAAVFDHRISKEIV
ncbi:MAG: hypothetical protein ACLSCV_07765 [Acutalibacteraceae bacterium]